MSKDICKKLCKWPLSFYFKNILISSCFLMKGLELSHLKYLYKRQLVKQDFQHVIFSTWHWEITPKLFSTDTRPLHFNC